MAAVVTLHLPESGWDLLSRSSTTTGRRRNTDDDHRADPPWRDPPLGLPDLAQGDPAPPGDLHQRPATPNQRDRPRKAATPRSGWPLLRHQRPALGEPADPLRPRVREGPPWHRRGTDSPASEQLTTRALGGGRILPLRGGRTQGDCVVTTEPDETVGGLRDYAVMLSVIVALVALVATVLQTKTSGKEVGKANRAAVTWWNAEDELVAEQRWWWRQWSTRRGASLLARPRDSGRHPARTDRPCELGVAPPSCLDQFGEGVVGPVLSGCVSDESLQRS